jgi:predicted AlkP superfamily pyrophosphatase or phosphodiesterase
MKKKILILSFSLITIFSILISTPRLTVVFVIDQFAYHYIDKIKPNITGGIKKLITKGIFYKNAYMPHAYPSTAVGHVAINTGTFAKNHGIIGNSWLNKKNEKTRFENINVDKKYAVFSQNGTYKYAASPENIMVDGISDQFVLKTRPKSKYVAFAISHKPRSAIGIAGKQGKAIWFEEDGRHFTSSKAYFDKMPEWIREFNQKYLLNKISKNYVKTPHASQHAFDLAKKYLEINLSKNKNDKFLLMLGISPLDPLGHVYGPESQQAINMVYNIDRQMGQFIEYVENKIGANNILFVLTADHGVMPISKIVHRINPKEIVDGVNKHIKKIFGVSGIILKHLQFGFYRNNKIFENLPVEEKNKINTEIKLFLEKWPGIRKIWTHKELEKLPVTKGSIDSWFKNQIYAGRSGDYICKTMPYSAITRHKTGTHHKTPYEYDTHVPLVIYQKGKLENKIINKKVLITQLANSLAKILEISKPSASRFDPLPGI